MNSEGSDKGSGWHNYSRVYHAFFDGLRSSSFAIFELGMGTTNPDIKSNMGPSGRPGASLRGWSRYFINAEIYGADIDPEIVGGPHDSERITTAWVDQTNPQTIASLWERFPTEFEIMIDDGLHEGQANVTFLENSHHKLSQTGVWIIEDITPGDVQYLSSALQKFCARERFEYRMLEIPNGTTVNGMYSIDNRIALLARK